MTDPTPHEFPLAGLRVLDLTRVLAGPWATQILADLGAEVVKIERPGEGDDTRGWGPPFLRDGDGNETRDSAYFLAANRSKRSVALDLATEDGRAVLRRLALKADVLVENFKAGTLRRWGLDRPALAAENPGLIVCSITGFGQTGPYAERPGYDFIAQGLGGLMSITGEADDRPGGGPQKVGVAVVDLMTGMYATVGVLAALQARARTGQGQAIDLSLMDVQVQMLANMATNYLVSGRPPRRWGNAHPNIVPYQVFEASDGPLVLCVGNDEQWRRFCAVTGRADLLADPRFTINADRVRNRDLLLPQVAAIIAGRTRAAWQAALDAGGVPCGPVNDLAQVFADPHVVAKGLALHLPHAAGGVAPTVRSPLLFSDTPVRAPDAPPLLGAHTDEVLAEWLGAKR